MPRIKLILEYDGSNFVGWQYQPNGRSVQEEIERAIQKIYQTKVRIVGGGRTDAGVHARGQVASFQVEKEVDVGTIPKSLNAVLPEDVVVKDAQEAVSDFHARYSAKSRRYKYYISQEYTAIQRNYCWRLFYRLDFDLMEKCAVKILGDHNFRSFCKIDEEAVNYNCVVQKSGWTQKNKCLEFEVIANRFLHGMVRALVGTMVNVGRGYTTVSEYDKILAARDRKTAGMSAPAKGLFLEEILY